MNIRMRFIYTGKLVFLLLILANTSARAQSDFKPFDRKGKFYIYWGWNRAWYTKSDIHFKGEDYNFKLFHVIAHDRPTPFDLDDYVNPLNATIPQTDFRIGFFIKDNYSVSFGFDHMKYVMDENQTTKIAGYINNTETVYDGEYSNADITIAPEFLKFEHTNGLNYINVDIRRFDEIFSFGKIKFNLTEGIGAGVLIPKTSTTLFNKNNNDQYHLSGYGISTVLAGNISLFKFLFLQTELKNGFINMPDIRISKNNNESASQSFFFTQFNVLIGATFRLHRADHDIQ